ncbi:MAG: 1-acyl-sn-glycerol-3-phosphate acyltransferase [Gemmatimonadetes bacterium]|nr:lysophospholipid acyltransferase family protein [Gemmatimonadota bacterium]MDE2678399.1 lysophospholipid acyltransferase family protein [Gemmatimonadota bacterium]MXX34271.1 1-acyl-sn-glycerol-3-phosphate acyltransferase [Gemmatimonadota bacterium]MYA12425.1 1-acyl-sn-glycerol-3-phosphate acyltransferase [Gemmatimonadota bacterium]MYD14186.1 1-acyl-sn-glycerol-3-phosphate acyltransferase [Gemmatimonadota bacterium]
MSSAASSAKQAVDNPRVAPGVARRPPGTEAGPARPQVPPARWPVVVARGLATLSWTAAIAALLLVLWVPTVFRPRSAPVLRARARRRLQPVWGRGLMRVLGVRVATAGQPPPAGALIVSNHLSYLDIPVLDSVMPMVFVARADLRRWPFWGPMASLGGTIYVDRATRRDVLRVRREMGEAMARGDSVIVFPEATTSGGDTILPFKPALLADAAEANTPVFWLTLSYRTPPDGPAARDQVCWWGDANFLPHVLGLFALRRVECTMRFGDRPLRAGNRKVLAAELRRVMMGDFEPTAGRKASPGAERTASPVAERSAPRDSVRSVPRASGQSAPPGPVRKAPPDSGE